MAIELGDAVVKLTGDTKDLDKALESTQSKVKASMEQMQGAFRAAGLALTAVGVAGLAMVDSARKMNAQLGQTGLTIGANADEMRNLALETTNVTFPLESVTATFELLARAGIKDQKVLKDSATAFDTLGDATGSSAEVVASQLIPAFKLFGVELPKSANDLDNFTWLAKNTTVELAEFGSVMSYVAQYGGNLNLALDDMVAIMAVLESKGQSGSTATKMFRTAVTQAASGAMTLNEALGITQQEVDGFRDKMEGATGITQEYADVANTQYGIMDKVKQKWSELTLKVGSLLTPLEPVLAAMTTLGPVFLFLGTSIGRATIALIAHTIAQIASAAKYIVLHPLMVAHLAITKLITAAQWLWNAALTANPIGLIVVAIGGLIAAGVALWRNWDKVTDFFKDAWSRVKVVFLTGIEKMLGALRKFLGWIPKLGDKIEEAHEAIKDMIDAEQVAQDARAVEKTAAEMAEKVEARAKELRSTVEEELKAELQTRLNILKKSRDEADEAHQAAIDAIREEYGILESTEYSKMDLARNATEAAKTALDEELSAARSVSDKKIALLQKEYDQKIRTLNAEADAEIAGYQAQIDALDTQTEQEEQILREVERQDRLLELQGAVASAETAEEEAAAKERLIEYVARITRERLLEARRAEKDALRVKISETRDRAQAETDRLAEELEAQKTHETEVLIALEARIEDEKVALDEALTTELTRLDEERIAFEAAEDGKLVATKERLAEETAAINAVYATRLEDAAVYAEAMKRALYDVAGAVAIPSIVPNLPAIPGMQSGGIAMRPMTVRVGEQAPRVPEAMIPLDRLGGMMGRQSVNVIVELDGRVLAQAIGEPLVDEIRLRTGVNV